jgi:hypothetical protein
MDDRGYSRPVSPAKGTQMLRIHHALSLVAILAAASAVHASGAGFVVGGKGIDLGKPEEAVEKGETVYRYKAKAVVGKPFTLTAQGVVYPRGAVKGQPSAPDSGAWGFDAKALKKSATKGKADRTEVAVTLTPRAAGASRVRFVGKILGYDRSYEVLVEAADPKAKE